MDDRLEPAASLPPTPAAVTLRQALAYWLALGFISFGGPAGQIALMHEELVERRRWISENRFLHALNYCMVLPGPEAQQLATYIGWLMHRSWGGIVAGGLFVLPSFFILVALSWLYVAFGHIGVVAGMFYGIKPAVTAIVVSAAWRIGSRVLKNGWLWGIAVAAFVAIFAFDVAFPMIVLIAAIVGYAGGRIDPLRFAVGPGGAKSERTSGVALIDDDTPTPAHARFSWRRFSLVVALGLGLWAGAIAALALTFGWHVRAAVAVHPGRAGVGVHGVRPAAGDRGGVLRHQAGRHRAGRARGLSRRHASVEERLAVGHRSSGLRGHLRAPGAVPAHRAGGGPHRLLRRPLRA